MLRKILKYISTAALGLTVITAVPSAVFMTQADEEEVVTEASEEVSEVPFQEYTIAEEAVREEVPAEIVEKTEEYSEEPADTSSQEKPADLMQEEYTEPAAKAVAEMPEAISYTESDTYYEAVEDALTYRDDLVEIQVSSTEEYTIPERYSLQVTPILEGEENETEYSYEEVQTQIESVKEDIAGFLAYDIKLVDEAGNKIEPDGKVAVSMKYTDAVLPVETEDELNVTVMHLEENEEGEVENVVDLNEVGQIDDLSTNDENKVEAISFTTYSFSVYTVTWTYGNYSYSINCHYVDVNGRSLLGKTGTVKVNASGSTMYLSYFEENIEGYVLNSVRMSNYTGMEVDAVGVSAGKYMYRYADMGMWSSLGSVRDVYYVYSPVTNLSLTMNYVDTAGNALAKSVSYNTQGNSEYNMYEYRKDFVGYNNLKITLDTPNGSKIVQGVRRNGEKMEYLAIDGTSWMTWNPVDGMYNAYYVSEKLSTDATDSLGVPEHSKTIQKNMGTDDGADSYTLSLDITGKQITPDPIDILLIVDYSASMNQSIGSTTRIQAVNNAIQTLKDGLKTTSTMTNIRFNVVGFNGPENGSTSDGYYQTSSNDAFKVSNGWINYNSYVPTYSSCDGGTNWQAGIRIGNEEFNNFQPNANKYVIFLTDGAPTFRYNQTYNSFSATGSTRYTYGSGTNDPNLHNFNCAVAQYMASSNLRAADETFIVAASATKNDETETKCDNFATAIGIGTSNVLPGYNEAALTEGFRQIAERIALAAYRNVVIQDTLSENVDFAFDVTKNNAASNISVYKTVNGRKTKLSSSKYTIDTALLQQGIVSVKLKDGASEDGYPLDDNATYSVEFNVIPSKTAMEAEMHNIPTVKGDPGTDAPGNSSSGGMDGYYSNAQDTTFVQYDEAGVTYVQDYLKPVIQVNTTSHSVEKNWLYTSEEELAGASVTLRLVPTAKVNNKIVNLMENGFLAAEDITAVVSANDNWTHTWNALPKYYYYYDAATGLAKHTPILYSAEEVNASGDFDVTVEEKNDTTTVVTNTKRGELTVNKVWKNGNEAHSDDTVYVLLYKDGTPFVADGKEVAVRLNAENNWTASFGALGDVEHGNFSVKELEGCSENQMDGTAYLANAENIFITYTRAVENGTICTLSEVDYTAAYGDMTFTDAYHGTVSVTNTPKYNSITLNKVDSLDSSKKLSGAEFKLEVFENGEWKDYEVDGQSLTVTSGSDGKVLFDNLPNGKYRITEVKAPEGYTLLADPIEIEMPNLGNETNSKYNFTYSDPLTKNDLSVNYKAEGTVKNSPIYTLPNSGGIGTYLFTIVGVGIMAAAAILYLRNRRK